MTTTVLPKNLNYNLLKPVGYPSKVVNYKFTPMTQIGQNTNDIVRFNISTNGFWDPYSAYIELDVDCTDMDFGTLQVDNSAHSFINELLITQSGTEIERIQEYDVLAAMLNDMHYNIGQRSNKKHEGFGYVDCGNLRTDIFGRQLTSTSETPLVYNTVTPKGAYSIYSGFKPLFDNSNSYTAYCKPFTSFKFSDMQKDSTGVGNPLLASLPVRVISETVQRFDLTYQQINNTSYIDNNTINYRRQKKGTLVSGTTEYVDKISSDDTWMKLEPYYGYSVPFTRSMSGTCFEPHFSSNFVQSSIIKGQLDQNQIINKGRFCIPIMSGLIGVLMPKESYKYIPMSVLNELQLEFRLNPFAMFTSGYVDDPKITKLTAGNTLAGTIETNYITALTSINQQRRRWKITKFDIHVEIHHFEPAVENQILSNIQTEDGIILHTNSWMFGPYYQFSANQQPSGNYQINLGFESLKNLMFCFIPNDWLSYTFCRKQFRINHNITSIQYKLGQQFFPSEKLSGHAGLPRGIGTFDSTNDNNNSVFLMELYKAFGKLNNVDEDCFINCDNFAVNQRPYDPSDTSALYTLTGAQLDAYSLVQSNFNTAAGQPLFHENRCVGKAIYAMNFETLNTDNSVISGINTIGIKPFDIILQSDSLQFTGSNNDGVIDPRFPRSSTMYTFCHYDMLIKISKTGTVVIGRG